MRAHIDMTEVEARTKIRAKYLRAIENEEWDLLPGPVYVKSFLRTYGDFLGLDSRMLVDEYKRRLRASVRPRAAPGVLAAPRARARRPRTAGAAVAGDRGWCSSRSWWRCSWWAPCTTAATRPRPPPAPAPPATARATASHRQHRAAPKPKTVTLQLVPTGQVYVCLVDGSGAKLIPGQIFGPGQTIPTEKSDKLLLTLGNASRAHEGQRQERQRRSVRVPRSGIRCRRPRCPRFRSQSSRAAHERDRVRRPPVRAGILVTGTEVLTGIISDRNGPWLSERAARDRRRRGDDPDRRRPSRRSARGARVHAARGNGADRHQRRAGPDRRRPDRRDRGPVRRPRDGARHRARGEDRRDPATA